MPIGAFRLNTISAATAVTESYWFNILSGNGVGDQSLKSAVDSSGNIFVAANYTADESGLMYKFNKDGSLQWQRAAPTSFVIRDVAVDSSGNPYFCGGNETSSPIKPWLTKLNTSGFQQWSVQYTSGVTATHEYYSMVIDSSGIIHLAGRQDTTTGYWNISYVRYNTGGSLSGTPYTHSLGSTRYTQSYAIATNGTNTFIGGQDLNGTTYTGHLMSVTASGATVNHSVTLSSGVTTSGNNQIRAIVNDIAGNPGYFSAGGTAINGGNACPVIYRTTLGSGSINWTVRISSVAGYCQGITQDSSGNVYVVYNNYISKLTNTGTLSWTRQITPSSGTVLLNGIKWVNNNIYVTGRTNLSGTLDSMIWKLPDDGTKTGTYGSYTYASASVTTDISSTSVTTATPTSTTRSTSSASVTATQSTTTMTSTTTTL